LPAEIWLPPDGLVHYCARSGIRPAATAVFHCQNFDAPGYSGRNPKVITPKALSRHSHKFDLACKRSFVFPASLATITAVAGLFFGHPYKREP